jgi:hypothetical protein
MIWSQVREAYPDQWLVVEALAAHTEGNRRLLDRIAVIKTCADAAAVMHSYQRLHGEYPSREFYFVHTGREDLDIRERRWIGIRRAKERATGNPSGPFAVYLLCSSRHPRRQGRERRCTAVQPTGS